MSNISQPHDKIVSKFLSDREAAIDVLKKNLPAKSLAKLDLTTLTASSETVVSPNWKKYHNDIVFHCKTKDKKKDTYIYTLIEHQSTPSPLLPVRLLRYKLNVLSKYLDAKTQPKKLPNIISLVIYHGKEKYPHPRDVFSCFEDKELAIKDITEPMHLLDLTDTPEEELLQHGGIDATLKILLKWSRDKNFIEKLQRIMVSRADIFLSLSLELAGKMFEYVMFVGKGTDQNAKAMENALQKIYGERKTKKIFSLADYYREEAMKKGEERGLEKGLQKGKKEGIQEGKKEAIKTLLKQGVISKEQAEKALQA